MGHPHTGPMNVPALAFALLSLPLLPARAAHLSIADVYPARARFAPSEQVQLTIELNGEPQAGQRLTTAASQLGKASGTCESIPLKSSSPRTLTISCSLPQADFQGYLVSVRLLSATGEVLDQRNTAVDISSDWKRFPRYGYLAHYNAAEGADPAQWIAELNRFHINGLEFYDFQYRHEQPLAGTVAHPADHWNEISNRPVDASVVRGFIDQGHRFNMMAMAYNASYGAYDDVFTRAKLPLPLEWATWNTPSGPRSAATAKTLRLEDNGWSTHFLYYMNQNDPGWQHYLFGQMQNLFDVYPFDGWQIDTYGDRGGYAIDGSEVDYVAGFKPYVDHAYQALHKRIVFNTVNALGQEQVGHSAAQFVHSELWDDHETFASILETAEQIHVECPEKAVVLAAYVNKHQPKDGPFPPSKHFNLPSVLLTDAAIFASGASHIELGDGDRMLSSEYFPADTRLAVSPELHQALRHYYDFLVAYENYLSDDMRPAATEIHIDGQPSDALGIPNTIWTIARTKNKTTVLHLINLLGSADSHWRDIQMTRTPPPVLKDLKLKILLPCAIHSAGWASPDVDGGAFHFLPLRTNAQSGPEWIEIELPALQYWDTIFLSEQP